MYMLHHYAPLVKEWRNVIEVLETILEGTTLEDRNERFLDACVEICTKVGNILGKDCMVWERRMMRITRWRRREDLRIRRAR